jgi:hypothetical protein
MLSSKITWQFLSLKTTLHPALHRIQIPKKDAVVMTGMIWPVRTVGRPGIAPSHVCDEKILRPSGRVTEIGVVARCLFRQGAPFVKNNKVAPVLAMASEGPTNMSSAWWDVWTRIAEILNVIMVALLSSLDAVTGGIFLVGYGDFNEGAKTFFNLFSCCLITAPNRHIFGYIVLCIALRQN